MNGASRAGCSSPLCRPPSSSLIWAVPLVSRPRSCCHLSPTTPLNYSTGESDPSDIRRRSSTSVAARPHVAFIHARCTASATLSSRSNRHRSTTAYLSPQPNLSSTQDGLHRRCRFEHQTRDIEPFILFDFGSVSVFHYASPVTLECPNGWAAEPMLRTLFLSRSRGSCAANDCSNSSRHDCSVVEVLTDRVPRFLFFSNCVVSDISAHPVEPSLVESACRSLTSRNLGTPPPPCAY